MSNNGDLDIEDIYELSPMQVGMLFQSMLAPASGVFVEQLAIPLHGKVVPAYLERAWQGVVDRMPALRSSFHWGDLEKPLQVVHRQVPIELQQLDWRTVPGLAANGRLTTYLRVERSRGFNLEHAPLMRIALIQESPSQSWFVWNFHHLLLDGWSSQLICQEVADHYGALLRGEEYEPPQRAPFSEYIAWLQSQDQAEAEAFWRAKLRGFSVPTAIGIGRTTAPTTAEGNDGEWTFRLSAESSETLRTFAKAQRITMNTLIQGAWSLLLGRYSGESDVVHGVVISGRPPELPGIESMIGLFINTLPVRVSIRAELPVAKWLQDLQARQMEISRYQYVSSLQIQQWSEVSSSIRLFDTVVVFENFPMAKRPGEQSTTEESFSTGHSDVPLSLVVVPGNEIEMKLLYDHRRFKEHEIQRMATHLSELLLKLVASPHNLLGDVSLLTPDEQQQISEWNLTAAPGYDEIPLMELLVIQAQKTPDAVAFIDGPARVSIRSIHEESNRFANYLASLGVGAGSVVGVCRERSIDAVIAFLALLKLRAVFLPLDPSYPAERLAYMVRDANADLVLHSKGPLSEMDGPTPRLVSFAAARESASQFNAECPGPPAQPEDLAYIIYTSGSLGRPKGVAVEHRVILNRLTWMWREYRFRPHEVGIMKTALNFVDAFWEMLGGLLQGVPTVIAPQNDVSDPAAFIDLLVQHSVTRLWFVPSFLEMLLESCPNLGSRLPALYFWSSGGEPLSVDLYRRFQRAVPHGVLYNVFGASELWDATVFDPVRDGDVTDCVPIGRPIANTHAFILDGQRQPVPVGVTGTLYIGGPTVARGYINLDDLSRQRFLPDVFSNEPGARLYDTGDLARFRPDGVIEHLGRRDLQLKLRGFRVEPTEIEHLIESHRTVRESVVVSRRTKYGDQRLLAYVVPQDGVRDTEDLLAHLEQWLPSFMMPVVTWIDKMPLTPSGKRDRNRLSEFRQPAHNPTMAAAMTPLESSIVQQFRDVLGLESIALSDDFFSDLGGHSMLATRLLVRLRESIGLDLPLRTIFDAPTPALLAAAIERISRDKVIDCEAIAEFAPSEQRRESDITASIPRHDAGSGDYPLSFSQERLWFLDQLMPGNPFYNISSAHRIPFAVDHSILERALSELVRRHGALRTIFPLVAEEPVQRVLPAEAARCTLIDLGPMTGPVRDAELERIATETAQKPFDLSNGPLYRATLVRLGPFDSAFVFVVHHIIADNISLNIIFRELGALYSDEAAGRASSLTNAPLQYADFAVWQRNSMNGERLAPELAYWQQQLNNLGPLNLPTDRPRPPVQTYRGGSVPLRISRNTKRALYALGRESSATPFMLLLTAFYVLLHRYSQQDDLAVGVPIANRNRQELENVVGFFPNTLVLRVDLGGNPTFRNALARVREVALDAFSHQDVPFAAVVASLRLPQDLSRNPLFQVSFQLISQDEKSSGSDSTAEVAFDRGTAIFDLTLNLWEQGEEIRGHFEYNTDLFNRETVSRLSSHFQTLLDSLVHNSDSPLASLSILSSEECGQMLVDWNDNRAEVPSASLHSLVEAQVQLTPNAVALRKDRSTLTYAELDLHASSLVHRLQQFDTGSKHTVGVMLPPSFEMVVAILGILKSGNAYVPLDPATPRKRLLRMLDDAGVQLLITSDSLADLVPERRTLVIDLEESIAEVQPVHSLSEPSDIAYIIFTSGSTGIPKGVMIPHRAVVNYLTWCRSAYPVDEGIGAPLCSPLSSDMSVTSLFLPLLCGRSVVILDQEDVVESLDSALRSDQRFSFVKLTPAHLEALRSLSLGREVPANTAAFIVGGEQLLSETLALWRDEAPELKIFNEYGPTETTVGCVVQPIRAGDLGQGPVPIGRPIANTRLYVLDRYKQPAPIGVPGELYIGGDGVALGYAGAPELTEERFLPDPFSPGNGRIYRTGDLVRYRADGTLEFLGRVDAQVKIRGFRIEPGDIESAIRRHSAVEDVVVTVRDLGTADKRLIAYVVAKSSESEPSDLIQELRDLLRQELPAYMLPSALIRVDAIPLTNAGKVDLRALERNSSAEHVRLTPKIAPATPLEQLIANVVENVFGVESISANDDFFADLGGHSLLVTKVVARLRDYLCCQLPLRWMFQAPTVKDLAQRITSHDAKEAEVAERNAGIVLAVLAMSDEQVKHELSATGD